ncbi:MAG TPA: DUF2877 domain-containing protein [Streptosporangiaceae bacterium]
MPGSRSRRARPARADRPGPRPTGGPQLAGGPRPGQRVVPGVASLALLDVLRGPLRPGRVLAASPTVVYLDFGAAEVIALTAAGAGCPPNAVMLKLTTLEQPPGPGLDGAPGTPKTDVEPGPGQPGPSQPGDDAWAGNGRVVVGGLDVQIRRWWDPCPVFGPLSRARLDHGVTTLARVYAAAAIRPGLEGHDSPAALAACCAAGDLAGAVELAEDLVGLGPGLVPSGDSMLCGLLLALRLLGGATAGGTRPVWLADWLGAAVTGYAEQRTTALAAALLHCAARGQASEEVAAVLHGIAGQEPVEPAARRLLAASRASGAELTWGLMAGCAAALALSVPPDATRIAREARSLPGWQP